MLQVWHYMCAKGGVTHPHLHADLFLRDRARRAYALLPTLAPRLPFIGALLPPPPPPPIFVPGLGLLPAEQALELLAPPLTQVGRRGVGMRGAHAAGASCSRQLG
jgi:hypothetical protein